MRRSLTTLRQDGSFSFYSSLIEIEKYDFRSKSELETILKAQPESLIYQSQCDALSLFAHEYTHYLDLTCTTWGLEFLLRKNNVIKSLGDNSALQNSAPVFMLNLSEILVHSNLLNIKNKNIKLTGCKTEHSAIYNNLYGPIIVVHFSDGNEKAITTPLSMLSVLEANAYASEILCKIHFIEAKGNIIDLILLEQEVDRHLNSAELSEYSLLITLCRKHFDYLSLKESLIFYQSLAWRILNMSSLNLSIISAFLKYTFINRYIGDAICKDLQRGMSRQVVIFKFILMIHQFVNESSKREDLIFVLKNNPKIILDMFLKENSISVEDSLDFGESSEFSVLLNIAIDSPKIQEHKFIIDSSKHNFDKFKSHQWNSFRTSDFILPDIFLADGTVISPPKRVDLDIEKYFDSNINQIIEIEKFYDDSEIYKFHIHPSNVTLV